MHICIYTFSCAYKHIHKHTDTLTKLYTDYLYNFGKKSTNSHMHINININTEIHPEHYTQIIYIAI